MTTLDLHNLFKVEYDKANVISSYPSIVSEEIDVALNKAYLTLIGRKFAGNNVRNIPFEGDASSVSDLQSLITTVNLTTFTNVDSVNNGVKFSISSVPFLYYVSSRLSFTNGEPLECIFTNHDFYKKAAETAINKPWLPNPVCVLENSNVVVYYDTAMNPKTGNTHSLDKLVLTYCKMPKKINYSSLTDVIEVNDKMCNDIVSLAVYYALETVESQRVQTKSNDIQISE